jgi:hypothetical protein
LKGIVPQAILGRREDATKEHKRPKGSGGILLYFTFVSFCAYWLRVLDSLRHDFSKNKRIA